MICCSSRLRTSTTASISDGLQSVASSTARSAMATRLRSANWIGSIQKTRITKLYSFAGLKRVDETVGIPGDLMAIAGVEGITIGETLTSAENPKPMPIIQIDEPTIAMTFTINSSPFSGREGQLRYFAQSARPPGQGTADERFDQSRGGRQVRMRSR